MAQQQQLQVNDPEALRTQARLHYQMRDFLTEMAAGFQGRYDTVVSQLDSSQIGRYQQWWQTLKTHLLHEATAHEELGQRLEAASGAYTTAEQHTTHTFTEK